jgi:hypothetical protein
LQSLSISSPERAILECLYLAPEKMDLVECYQVMEGLTTLRPALLQQLLEQCHSIKVKRLFLYMAKKAGHDWFKRLNTEKLEAILYCKVYNQSTAIPSPDLLNVIIPLIHD